MNKNVGKRRVFAIIIDGLLCAFILFTVVLAIAITASIIHERVIEDATAWEYCWSGCELDPQIILIRRIINVFQIIIPSIFIISPVVAHGLIMSIFKSSVGCKIMGITVKNSDGSEPKRSKFLLQMLYGLLFSLSLGIVPIISGIKCLSSNQTITDKELHLQAFKRTK